MPKTVNKNLLLELHKAVQKYSNPVQAKLLQRFFKTGKGEYAEGDIFLGLMVPTSRKIAKQFFHLSLIDLKKLLRSKYHEERLIALFILVHQFQKGDEKLRQKIFDLYVSSTKWINNWDLVDTSAPYIMGLSLLNQKRNILFDMARSKILWERRIAIVSTFTFIRQKQFTDTLKIATMLLGDTHDLIHKAIGWMLREVGKKEEKTLIDFLEKYIDQMPRTSLRYAIERLTPEQKQFFMKR